MKEWQEAVVLVVIWVAIAVGVVKVFHLPWDGNRVVCVSKGQVVFRGMAQRMTPTDGSGCEISEAGTNQHYSCDVCK